MVTLKYSEMMNFSFVQVIQKLSSSPTHGATASKILKAAKAITEVKMTIQKEYQDELISTFAKKDGQGNVIRPEGQPMGFEIIEGKEEEFEAAQEKFGEKTVTYDLSPFTLKDLDSIKISANELDALKGLYVEYNSSKPELPTNVASIR